MSEKIGVSNVETSSTSYVDLVKVTHSGTDKTLKVHSFTILPVLNPEKSLFKCVFNGDTKFTDFKIGIEIEYPFPLPLLHWKLLPGKSLVIQVRSSDGTTVSAIGKIIANTEH